MKKIVGILLVLSMVMTLGIMSCSDDGSDDDDNNNTTSNPFLGTWQYTNTSIYMATSYTNNLTLIFTENTWTLTGILYGSGNSRTISESGTYTYNGNNATITSNNGDSGTAYAGYAGDGTVRFTLNNGLVVSTATYFGWTFSK